MLGEEEALAAFEWIRHNMWDLNCLAQRNQVNASGIPNTWTGVLPADIVAFAERSADQFFDLADQMEEGSWDINHIPTGPVDRVCMGAPDQWCVYKGVADRGNHDDVWNWVKWIGAGEWYQDKRRPPLRPPARPRPAPPTSGPASCARSTAASNPCSWRSSSTSSRPAKPAARSSSASQSVAEELLIPAMEAIYVEGSEPVSILVDISQQVTEAQHATLERMG